MDKIFYVIVVFENGKSLCETFFDVSDAVSSFNEWKLCSSAFEVTLEFKSCLDKYTLEDDDDES